MSKIIVVSFSYISKESQVLPTFFEIYVYIHPHEEKLKSIEAKIDIVILH